MCGSREVIEVSRNRSATAPEYDRVPRGVRDATGDLISYPNICESLNNILRATYMIFIMKRVVSVSQVPAWIKFQFQVIL